MAKTEASYYPQPRKGSGYRFKHPRTGKTIECAGVEWYLDYRDQEGKRKRHKAHTELCQCQQRRHIACEHERLAQQLIQQFNQGEEVSIGMPALDSLKQAAPPVLLTEKFQAYKDYIKTSRRHSHSYWLNIRQTLKNFGKWLEDNSISEVCQVTKETVTSYALYLQTENLAAKGKPERIRKKNTVNRYLRELRTLFFLFCDEGLISENPFRERKSSSQKIFLRVDDEKPITIFDDQELERLLALTVEEIRIAIKSYAETIYDMIPFFYQSGFRLGEVCNLTFAQIRGSKIYIEPHHDWVPKWGIRRSIPISATIAAILEKRKRINPASEYVFCTSVGTPFDEKNIYHRLKDLFDHHNIVGDTGLGVSPHSFRRTFCTQTLAAGTPLTVVQEWMGHSKPEMTMKYYSKIPSKTDHYIHQVGFISRPGESLPPVLAASPSAV